MRNFCWEGYFGSKLNHLVKWNLVTLPLKDEGLALGALKIHNYALLTKWVWKFAMKDSGFWRKIICSIHDKEPLIGSQWESLEIVQGPMD
ncbi:protein transport protein Sec24-like [Cucumis melo var. makuwa]|uniref:Protein transport protein Sec24-like n=1 Tax=Cucumis melo var. makuwa TaxID=1194695 RepID=A0A5A7V110_CUCMM|nr:protein transport protein Sec24-like [Cucumis melo var. makuwa]TYK24038.1 protein transport protein Sec24-like [Cucumis melo var. makuwa]